MVAVGADADLFTAVSGAVDNLEKQLPSCAPSGAIRKRHKTRHSARPKASAKRAEAVENAPHRRPQQSRKEQGGGPRRSVQPRRSISWAGPIFRTTGFKPMTVDEAMLEIDAAEDYFVFEEAGSDGATCCSAQGRPLRSD